MGEVYRARDTKLNRDVAIKVLPDLFATDPERLARFEREAQLLASLNHPAHRADLRVRGFPVRAAGPAGPAALVMELVDGPTLADRIAAGRRSARRGAADRAADRRSARGGARARDHPSRSETGQHQADRRRRREGARLRPREGARSASRSGGPTAVLPASTRRRSPNPDHAAGVDSRHRGLHGPGAGARPAGGQARRHLGVRRRGLRDADRPSAVRGRNALGHDRGRAARRDRLGAAAGRDTGRIAPSAAALPRARSEEPAARCRRRAARHRRRGARRVAAAGGRAAAARVDAVASGRRRGCRGRGDRGRAARAERLLTKSAPGAEPFAPVVRFAIEPPPEVDRHLERRRRGRRTLRRLRGPGRRRVPVLPAAVRRARVAAARRHRGRPLAVPLARRRVDRVLPRRQALQGVDRTAATRSPCATCKAVPARRGTADGRIVFSRTWLSGLSIVSADGGTPTVLTTPDRNKQEIGHWWPAALPDGRVLFTIVTAGTGLNDARIALLDPADRHVPSPVSRRQGRHGFPRDTSLFYRTGRYHAVPFDLSSGHGHGRTVSRARGRAGARSRRRLGAAGRASRRRRARVSRRARTSRQAGSRGSTRTARSRRSRLRRGRSSSVKLSPDGRRVATASLEAGRLLIRLLDLERGTEEVPQDRRHELEPGLAARWPPVVHQHAQGGLRRLREGRRRHGRRDRRARRVPTTPTRSRGRATAGWCFRAPNRTARIR